MSRWIDADEAVTMIALQMPFIIQGFEDNKRTAERLIGSIPSIDIVPKRGEWIGYNADKGDDWLRSDGEPIFLVCSKCYGTVLNNTSAHWNFCPNCGADMREREGE